MSEVITQVSAPQPVENTDGLPEVFYLNLRGQKFKLARETLLGLPESIIFSLSGGFTYSPDLPAQGLVPADQDHKNHPNESFYQSPRDDDNDLTPVDYNPAFLNYVLDMYHKCADGLKPPVLLLSQFPEFRGFVEAHAAGPDNPDASVPELALEPQILMDPNQVPKVLQERPSLIVLKEDIEYYVLPPENTSDADRQKIKLECGSYLVAQDSIFDELLQVGHVLRPHISTAESSTSGDASPTNESPEMHLAKMLYTAGIEQDAHWHIRQQEPYKTVVTSLQLSPLKVPKEGDLEAIQAVQKLLLFWKKPARKCWWSHKMLELNGVPVKVHTRKVWTLELTIFGIQV